MEDVAAIKKRKVRNIFPSRSDWETPNEIEIGLGKFKSFIQLLILLESYEKIVGIVA